MENTNSGQGLIKNFGSTSTDNKVKPAVFLAMVAVAVMLGVGVGFLPGLFNKDAAPTTVNESGESQSAGIVDKKTFSDSAEGVLREGGIDGEGNFHLERPGGKSQNVYLTSSTVDLSPYIGKEVKVWGQTFEGEKAGWLMDVGLVEVSK